MARTLLRRKDRRLGAGAVSRPGRWLTSLGVTHLGKAKLLGWATGVSLAAFGVGATLVLSSGGRATQTTEWAWVGWFLIVAALLVFAAPLAYVIGSYALIGYGKLRARRTRKRNRQYEVLARCEFAIVRTFGQLEHDSQVLAAVIERATYWAREEDGLWVRKWWAIECGRVRGHETWRTFYLAAHDANGDLSIIEREASDAGFGATVRDLEFCEKTLVKVEEAIALIPYELKARLRRQSPEDMSPREDGQPKIELQQVQRAKELLASGEAVRADFAEAWLAAKRRGGGYFTIVSGHDLASVQEWHSDVLALADECLSVDDRTDVALFPKLLPNMAGERLKAVIDHNLGTLRGIIRSGEGS